MIGSMLYAKLTISLRCEDGLDVRICYGSTLGISSRGPMPLLFWLKMLGQTCHQSMARALSLCSLRAGDSC
jgi:hypothetical protein